MTGTKDLGKFPLGKNNVAKETSLPKGSLRDAINVELDDAGNGRLREGYELLYAGDTRSLFKRYFGEVALLKYLNENNTATDITAINPQNRIDYTELNDLIYFTDGDKCGVLNGLTYSPLSIEGPLGISGSISAVGSLVPGRYQVTCAFIDNVTGELSGAPIGTQFELTATGSIVLNIPQSSEDYSIAIYMTNGRDGRFYNQITLPKGITSYTLSGINQGSNECMVQHLVPMPGGQIIFYYKGKIYVAKDNNLLYSEPQHYGLTRMGRNHFPFPARITIAIPVDTGIFVVADKTYFIAFNKDEEAKLTEPSQDKAVEGTGLLLMGSDLKLDEMGDTRVAYWLGEKGAMIGLPDGSVQNLTKKRLAIANNSSKVGSSLFKEYNGIKQVISTMPQGDVVSGVQASDSATLTIYRDGVLVE